MEKRNIAFDLVHRGQRKGSSPEAKARRKKEQKEKADRYFDFKESFEKQMDVTGFAEGAKVMLYARLFEALAEQDPRNLKGEAREFYLLSKYLEEDNQEKAKEVIQRLDRSVHDRINPESDKYIQGADQIFEQVKKLGSVDEDGGVKVEITKAEGFSVGGGFKVKVVRDGSDHTVIIGKGEEADEGGSFERIHDLNLSSRGQADEVIKKLQKGLEDGEGMDSILDNIRDEYELDN